MIAPGMHRFSMMERVVHGQPAASVVKSEALRLDRHRVFLIANRSLSETSLVASIAAGLDGRYGGCFAGVTAHGPRQCVIDGAAAARAAGADLLVAIGGGSVIDATKIIQLCLRHSIGDAASLSKYTGAGRTDPSTRPNDADEWIRIIAVPTTLSAAEFTWFGGAFHPERGVKESFSHAMMIPQVIVLDPQAVLTSPRRLLLTTGMKAVDHAAERLASLKSNPYNDAVSSLALKLLSGGMREIQRDPSNLDACADLQYGAFMSMSGSTAGVAVGIGHAIGHALGAHCGVPHGETSCVMLPAVMHWNVGANQHRQVLIADALDRKGGSAAAALADLIAELGLPRTLRDVGVRRQDFGHIASKALGDVLVKNNPRPVGSAADIEEILEFAW